MVQQAYNNNGISAIVFQLVRLSFFQHGHSIQGVSIETECLYPIHTLACLGSAISPSMASPSTIPLLTFRILSSSKLPRRAPTGIPAAFSWRFGTCHAYSYSGANYLENATNPLHEVSKRLWYAKKEPLWLSVIAIKHRGEKNSRCVRSWLVRRLRTSFVESLRKSGYSRDGTPLEDIQGDKEALYGTAQFFAERPMLKMSPKLLEEQTDKVVDQIIQLQSGKQPKAKKSPSTKKISDSARRSEENK